MRKKISPNKDINMKRRFQEVEDYDNPTRTPVKRTPTNQ